MKKHNHQSHQAFYRQWLKASITGVLFGIFAQLIRQDLGPLMYLGASTAPWVFIGFLLAFAASREFFNLRKAIFIAAGSIAIYLVAWLVSYHLLFVIREHLTLADGWHQIAPWLIATVPASLIIGTISALSHKRGLFGDIMIGVPLAWSLPETLITFKEGWMDSIVFLIPISFLSVLLIHMAKKERPVHMFTLLTSVFILGALGIALFSVVWFPFMSRF